MLELYLAKKRFRKSYDSEKNAFFAINTATQRTIAAAVVVVVQSNLAVGGSMILGERESDLRRERERGARPRAFTKRERPREERRAHTHAHRHKVFAQRFLVSTRRDL